MASLGKWSGGTIGTMKPGTSWGAAANLFPTEDRNDSSVYGFVSSTAVLTLPSSALADGYLIIAAAEWSDSSNGRYNPQLKVVQTSGTGEFVGGPTSGFSRDNSENRSYVRCWAFINGPSASATFTAQWKRDTDDSSTSDGTVRSEFQVIPFYYADVGMYTSAFVGASAAASGGTSPNQVTGWGTTLEGTNITRSGEVITVTGDNKRYLVLGSNLLEGLGGSRTQRWGGLELDGTFDDAAKAYWYSRNDANDEGGELWTSLFETVTASRTIESNIYRGDGVTNGDGGADIDGTDIPTAGAHSLVVIELNDSAEVFHNTGATNQNIATAGPIDIQASKVSDVDFNDSASFTRASDTGMNTTAACDALIGANISAASEDVTSTTRFTAYGEMTIDGVEVTDSVAGDYLRGVQGSQDCFGWSANLLGFVALATDEDIGISATELSGTEGGGGAVHIQVGWVGFWGINLDTMEGDADESHDVTDTATLAEDAAISIAVIDVGALEEDYARTMIVGNQDGGTLAESTVLDAGAGESKAGSDTGTLAESVDGIALGGPGDSGTAAEEATGTAAGTDGDIGTADDVNNGIELSGPGDVGTEAEAESYTATVTASDTGTEAEGVSGSAVITAADTGTLAETATQSETAALTVGDTGTLAESVTLTALVVASDTFTLADSIGGGFSTTIQEDFIYTTGDLEAHTPGPKSAGGTQWEVSGVTPYVVDPTDVVFDGGTGFADPARLNTNVGDDNLEIEGDFYRSALLTSAQSGTVLLCDDEVAKATTNHGSIRGVTTSTLAYIDLVDDSGSVTRASATNAHGYTATSGYNVVLQKSGATILLYMADAVTGANRVLQATLTLTGPEQALYEDGAHRRIGFQCTGTGAGYYALGDLTVRDTAATGALTALVVASDAGALAEDATQSETATLSVGDSGTLAEEVTASALATAGDAGATAEGVSGSAIVVATDTGTLAGDGTVVQGGQTVSGTDSGTLAEGNTLGAGVGQSDAVTASESVLGSAAGEDGDIGTADDQNNGIELGGLSDSGTQAESVTETADATATDTGALAESTALGTGATLLEGADTGTLAESLTLAAAFDVTDSGTLVESLALTVTLVSSDVGALSSIKTLASALAVEDTGTLGDNGQLLLYTGETYGTATIGAWMTGTKLLEPRLDGAVEIEV